MEPKNITVNRTTLTLYKSTFELLSQSPFDSITVNDICQHAIVSRSTFYSYFADKYELVIFCLSRERENLQITTGENVEENILMILNQLKEKQSVYQNIFLAQTNRELNQMIIAHSSGFIRYNIAKKIGDEEKLNILTILVSSGIAGTIMWWIEKDFSVQAKILAKYINSAIRSLSLE